MVSKCSILLVLAAGFFGFYLNSAHADVSAIEGSAYFVLHHTIVPMDVIRGKTPERSQPYWALNIISDGTDYEVDQQFNLGDDSAPDSIEVGGVTIPEGLVVSLEGEVTYSADHFAYLQNIDHVALVRKDY